MMKFESTFKKYKYIEDRYGMEKVCLNCKRTFGKHSGTQCNNDDNTTFLLVEEIPNGNGDPNLEFLRQQAEKFN